WCAPCIAELRALARESPGWRAAGLRVVALGVEGDGERAGALGALRSLGWPFETAFASGEALSILDALQQTVLIRQRPLPLPSSLLVDGEGKVAAIWKGALDPAALHRELAGLRRTPEEDRSAAAPFPGRWHAPLPPADLGGLEGALRERGLARAADGVAARRVVRVPRTRAQILYEFGMDRWNGGDLDRAIGHFREAAALEPGFFEARSCLGILLHRTGRLPEAIEVFRQAQRLAPQHVPTLYNLGLALAQSGKAEESRAPLDALEALDPAAARRLRAAIGRGPAR
ncbi:MAG: tetratricopeptide repeat protein, partial [Planctomycetota bacterium]